jgi:hypothetical protein
LAALGVEHYRELFKEPEKKRIKEILRQVSLFFRLIEEEENCELFKEVTLDKL